jgi:hypothetical protein
VLLKTKNQYVVRLDSQQLLSGPRREILVTRADLYSVKQDSGHEKLTFVLRLITYVN